MQFNPYFVMDGNAEQAIATYKKAFNAEAKVMKYKDAPQAPGSPAMPENVLNLVMHGEVRIGETAIMVSDAHPDFPVNKGNNVQIAVSLESAAQVDRIYAILSMGGVTFMAPHESFFAQKYANFTDAFGIGWQLIAPKQQTVDTWA